MQGEQAVWDNLLTWLSTTTSKSAVQDCAIGVLAVIADRGLAPNLQPRLPQLWSLPVLQHSLLAATSAHLICAAFAQGAPAGLQLVCFLSFDLHVTSSISPVCWPMLYGDSDWAVFALTADLKAWNFAACKEYRKRFVAETMNACIASDLYTLCAEQTGVLCPPICSAPFWQQCIS